MSEPTLDYDANPDDTEGDQSNLVTLRRSEIRTLQRKAKTADDAEARAAAAERRLAFATAGIDLADPRMGYFIRGYDGDVTTEAIRKAATDAGFLTEAKPPPPAPPAQQSQQQQPPASTDDSEPQRTPEEVAADELQRQALEAMRAATLNPTAPGETSMQQQMMEALKRGGSEGLAQWMQGRGLPVVRDD